MRDSLQTSYLRLAARIMQSYVSTTQPQAVLLTGSVAEGRCDAFSDIDMIMYYDELPSELKLEKAHALLFPQDLFLLAPLNEEGCIEDFHLQGVECQVVHCTVAAWEETMNQVFIGLDVVSPNQKALSGLLRGQALYGDTLIAKWQERVANYPDALGHAMIAYHLKFFAIWYREEFMLRRDARLWIQEILVETGYNILGILAGLNRQYYTSFQLKHMRDFIAKLQVAPIDLAHRLERLCGNEPAIAIQEAEQLVKECVMLINKYLPDIDTTQIARRLDQRQRPWNGEIAE